MSLLCFIISTNHTTFLHRITANQPSLVTVTRCLNITSSGRIRFITVIQNDFKGFYYTVSLTCFMFSTLH